MTKPTTPVVALSAVALSALAWIDPLYIPLITLGPIVTGLVAGATGAVPARVAAIWLSGGILVLLTDLAVNQEDVAFHAVVAAITACLSGGAGALARRLRRPATKAQPASAT